MWNKKILSPNRQTRSKIEIFLILFHPNRLIDRGKNSETRKGGRKEDVYYSRGVESSFSSKRMGRGTHSRADNTKSEKTFFSFWHGANRI